MNVVENDIAIRLYPLAFEVINLFIDRQAYSSKDIILTSDIKENDVDGMIIFN